MTTSTCDLCGARAVGHLDYEDGEILEGCAECLLEVVADPAKPVEAIVEWPLEENAPETVLRQ
jgi:hypothetical protein